LIVGYQDPTALHDH